MTAQAIGCTAQAPAEQIEGIRLHTLTELDNARRGALTAYNLLGLFEGGGSITDLVRHLYPPHELEQLRAGQTASITEEEAGELNLLRILKAHAQTRGVQYNDGRDNIRDQS